MTTPNYRQTITDSFTERRQRNPGYSLRAFARDLQVSPSHLCEVLQQRENISPKVAAKLVVRMGLGPREAEFFMASVQAVYGRSNAVKKQGLARLSSLQKKLDFKELTQGTFDAITNWYHLAILELLRLPQSRPIENLPQWIAKKLDLHQAEVDGALRRMTQLGLLQKKANRLVPTNQNIETTANVSSAAIRHFHDQILKKASQALHQQGVDQRSMNSLVLAFPKNKVSEAAKMINDFCRKFNETYDSEQGPCDSVYCLGFQFFELTTDKEVVNDVPSGKGNDVLH